jgi:hypothetical protein
MAQMSGLSADCFPAMAVDASNLALLDLRSEVFKAVFIEGERYDASASLGSDVVELQDDDVGLTTAHARRVPKVIQEEAEIAPLQRAMGRDPSL